MKSPAVLRGQAVALAMCAVLTYSSSAMGFNSLASGAIRRVSQLHLFARPHFSHAPTKAFLGKRPSRDPMGRGGVWTPALRQEILRATQFEGLYASQGPILSSHSIAVAASSGSSYPWEGSAATTSGSVNTGNGNKVTQLHLTGWKARGLPVDFTLYHNSQTNYSDELGYGWTWSYDIYINSLTTNPVVHWADGLSIPYTASSGTGGGIGGGGPAASLPQQILWASTNGGIFTVPTYTAPAGIFDTLVQNTDTTWTVTKKDKTVYHFNTAGFCDSITDRNGNTISLTLNAYNYVTRITDSTGRYLTINVNGSNKFTGITDPAGHTWSFTINGSGDLSTVTWPSLGDGNTYTDQYAYTSHQITSHTDKRGKTWSSTYNTDGSLNTETDPLSHTTTYGYASSATTITDPLSHVRTDNYASGLLASTVDTAGFSTSYTSRNSNNLPLTVVDGRGKTWTYTYDGNGNVLTVTDPLSHVKTYTYSSFNEVLTSTDALSHTLTYTYDSNGNLLTETDPLSRVTNTVTYGSYGLIATVANGAGNTTSYGYDSYGNPTTVTDPLSHVTTVAYDSMNRASSVTDALSHVETTAYDAWGRVSTVTHADSSSTSATYNAEGAVVTSTDELGHTTTNTYDDAGRLTGVSNARGDVESYGYDNANHRTSVTNGRGKTRTYTFTNRGEVASLTMPDGAVEQWTYDGTGHTTAYTNPLSQTISYTYDNAGRQTGITYPSGTNPTFGYDNADRRTSMVDSTGTTTWTFDNAGRLTSLATPQGTMSYTYDAADRRATMVESAGTWTYGYDAASRLTSEQNPFSETTTFAYDNVNRLTSKTFANGQVDVIGYDNRNRQTSVSHNKSDTTVLSSESYVYDVVGNMTSKTVDGVTTTYGYDAIDQLTSESRTGYSASYTYDANGNRLSKTLNGTTDSYTYDDGDKLLTAGSKSYTYDAAGRTKTVVSGSATTTLNYDYEGRVTSIVYPSSATNTFTYNGLDTRVGKVDSAGTATYKRNGAGVTDDVLSDGSASYTSGVSERRSGVSKFYGTDHLGTTTQETSSAQAVTATKSYDAFGLLTSTTGASASPFGFAGEHGYQEDGDSGLKLLGHRYYDPSTGRFLTRDTAKEGRNWYTYCSNNPIAHVDANGLDWKSMGLRFLKGLVIGAVVATVIVVAAPVAVSGLVWLGATTAVASGIVTTTIFVGGTVGLAGTTISTVKAVQRGDWDQVAENAGGVVGSGIVGGFGGGRRLGGMDGNPSPAPPMRSIGQMLKYEKANVYDPSLGPPGLNWMGTKPTPASGGAVLIGAGGGVASLF